MTQMVIKMCVLVVTMIVETGLTNFITMMIDGLTENKSGLKD